MKTLTTILFAMLTVSCATDYKVKPVENHIEIKGQVGNRMVGLNDKKELIMQEENDASDELRIQEHVNLKLDDELQYEAHQLKTCRTDVSDPRLGGNGLIPEVPEIDGMKSTEEVKEEIGITNDGDIKVVKKSYFIEKLKLERKYERSLRSMIKVVSRHKEECEYKMGMARREHGLPSTRYQGEGYFKDGVFVQNKPNEASLDDAFEIQAKQKPTPKTVVDSH